MPRLSVELSSETAKAILGLARDVAPKEFSSFIAGRLEKGVLRLDGLLYQPYTASEDSAWVHVDLPLTSGAKATVHSHPSGGNRPSRADLHFFAKHGLVNFIAAAPFAPDGLACYDTQGRRLPYRIVASESGPKR